MKNGIAVLSDTRNLDAFISHLDKLSDAINHAKNGQGAIPPPVFPFYL